MRLSQVKALLPTLEKLGFQLENGAVVPEHFHVTEVGMVTKHFIDCGGVIRTEKTVSFQLWTADDFEHRLKPARLLNIIRLSEEKLGLEDAEVEVEYQAQTIGKYGLAFDGTHFLLQNKTTACLAEDACGLPPGKTKKNVAELSANNACTPGSGCC
ncbi:MAG: hypothetical protein EAS48_09460 [Chryseobacterium sp.]|nr:MAG: hypothetical protein EAS48_09460 [Chryseobacterium sp.]